MSTVVSALPPRNTPTERATSEAPLLQWANGKLELAVNADDPKPRFFSGQAGFFTETGIHAELDQFCGRYQVPSLLVRHARSGGPAKIVRHWNLGEEIGFVPITSGPVRTSVAASLRSPAHERTAAAGIGLRWPEQGHDGRKGRSRMAVRGYLVLQTAGARQMFTVPMSLTAHSLMTDYLLAALVEQAAVCAIAERIWGRPAGSVNCYDLRLPLGPGEEIKLSNQAGDSTTLTPFRSLHPATGTGADGRPLTSVEDWAAYLPTVRCPEGLSRLVSRDWPAAERAARDF
ncbi:MAG TPA: hypothetical protein VNL71_07375, partial [Chloroflexota bacterium]|nr:hypothetical protein [Chloroflexota bacterium]